MAVEFRNSSWLDKRRLASTFNMLRAHDLIHVIMDAPSGVKNCSQTVWEVTNPALALVRLHGRNATTWNATGAASASVRFDHDYVNDELTGLAGSIRYLASRVARTHVIFNNCFEDQGQRNARSLMQILAVTRSSLDRVSSARLPLKMFTRVEGISSPYRDRANVEARRCVTVLPIAPPLLSTRCSPLCD
jgi:uncharacterized protein YecE (DUF72 family)